MHKHSNKSALINLIYSMNHTNMIVNNDKLSTLRMTYSTNSIGDGMDDVFISVIFTLSSHFIYADFDYFIPLLLDNNYSIDVTTHHRSGFDMDALTVHIDTGFLIINNDESNIRVHLNRLVNLIMIMNNF